MSSGSFKNVISKIFTNHMYLIYMYKQNLAENNLQLLICHKTKLNYEHLLPTDHYTSILYPYKIQNIRGRTHVHIYIHARKQAQLDTYISMQTHTLTYTYTHIYIYTYIYKCLFVSKAKRNFL